MTENSENCATSKSPIATQAHEGRAQLVEHPFGKPKVMSFTPINFYVPLKQYALVANISRITSSIYLSGGDFKIRDATAK